MMGFLQTVPLLSTVQVQLGVLAGAVAAALLGLLAYAIKYGLGLVKPLPPEEDAPKHH
jgi:hypothetical protein